MMRLDRFDPHHVEIVLSERNLLALLSKVRREGSARTLYRDTEEAVRVTVRVEPDTEHYVDRDPGEVHPLDEP